MLGRERLRMIARTAGPPTLCLLMLGCGQQLMTPMAAEALAPPPNLLDEITNDAAIDGGIRRARQLQSGIGQPRRLLSRVRSNCPQSRRTCETGMPVYGMQVSGDQVHFGSFNGTI